MQDFSQQTSSSTTSTSTAWRPYYPEVKLEVLANYSPTSNSQQQSPTTNQQQQNYNSTINGFSKTTNQNDDKINNKQITTTKTDNPEKCDETILQQIKNAFKHPQIFPDVIF